MDPNSSRCYRKTIGYHIFHSEWRCRVASGIREKKISVSTYAFTWESADGGDICISLFGLPQLHFWRESVLVVIRMQYPINTSKFLFVFSVFKDLFEMKDVCNCWTCPK